MMSGDPDVSGKCTEKVDRRRPRKKWIDMKNDCEKREITLNCIAFIETIYRLLRSMKLLFRHTTRIECFLYILCKYTR